MTLPDYKSLVDYTKNKEIVYIANCMALALNNHIEQIETNTYNLLCDFVLEVGREVMHHLEETPTDYQILCDIVADLYFDCDWGYRNEDETINIENYETGFKTVQVVRTLDDKDIKEQNRLKVEMASELYFNTIYDWK